MAVSGVFPGIVTAPAFLAREAGHGLRMTGATPVWDPHFIETLEGSFSAASTATIARVGAFFSIFRDLQDFHSFAPLRIQNFKKKKCCIFSAFLPKFCKILVKNCSILTKFQQNFTRISQNCSDFADAAGPRVRPAHGQRRARKRPPVAANLANNVRAFGRSR